jgi:acyl dehydratase
VVTSTVERAVVEQYCALVGESTAELGSGIPASFFTMSTADVFADAARATVPETYLERGVIVGRSIDVLRPVQPGMELSHTAVPSSLSVGANGVRIEFHIVSTHEGDVVAEHSILMALPGVSNPIDIGSQTGSSSDAPWVASETTDIPVDESLTTRYASLTGEDGAVHVSQQAAVQLGFEAPILQASCTLGLVAAVSRRLPLHPVATVSGIGVRFRAPVIPPGVLTARFSAPQVTVGPGPERWRGSFDASSGGVKVCEGRFVWRAQPIG